MDLTWYRDRLRAGGEAIGALLCGLDDETARWRPAEDVWSILEIVNHLADEEAEDFRARLRSTLENPAAPWPGIDPPAWVAERGYAERDLGGSVARFRAERAESLAWLATLQDPAWENVHEHPLLGELTAADLLTSWHAHDQLHLRQLGRRLYEYAAAETGGGAPGYAGPW